MKREKGRMEEDVKMKVSGSKEVRKEGRNGRRIDGRKRGA